MKGFTLVEILVVIAIITFIISFGILIDVGTIKRDYFAAEEATIVSALEKARSRSMANIYETAHGVCFISPNYIIFREKDGHCVSGVASNETISANTKININFPTVVFSQLAGTTTDGVMIVIKDGIKTATTTLNYEGTIIW